MFENFTCAKIAKAVTQYKKALCIRGYHVYKVIWEATVRETVVCMLDPGNIYDRNAVEKDGKIIGQLPREVSRFCAFISEERQNHSLHGDWMPTYNCSADLQYHYLTILSAHRVCVIWNSSCSCICTKTIRCYMLVEYMSCFSLCI